MTYRGLDNEVVSPLREPGPETTLFGTIEVPVRFDAIVVRLPHRARCPQCDRRRVLYTIHLLPLSPVSRHLPIGGSSVPICAACLGVRP
jgi:hypothetical protein